MSDDEFFTMLFITFAVTLWVMRLVYVNRKLKKTVAALESGAAEAAAPQALEPQQPQRAAEVDELRQRVQVLERIVTDGSPTLSREIDSLRQAG